MLHFKAFSLLIYVFGSFVLVPILLVPTFNKNI